MDRASLSFKDFLHRNLLHPRAARSSGLATLPRFHSRPASSPYLQSSNCDPVHALASASAESFGGKGFYLKRVSYHSKGRSGIMVRPRCRLTVVVRETTAEEEAKIGKLRVSSFKKLTRRERQGSSALISSSRRHPGGEGNTGRVRQCESSILVVSSSFSFASGRFLLGRVIKNFKREGIIYIKPKRWKPLDHMPSNVRESIRTYCTILLSVSQ